MRGFNLLKSAIYISEETAIRNRCKIKSKYNEKNRILRFITGSNDHWWTNDIVSNLSH